MAERVRLRGARRATPVRLGRGGQNRFWAVKRVHSGWQTVLGAGCRRVPPAPRRCASHSGLQTRWSCVLGCRRAFLGMCVHFRGAYTDVIKYGAARRNSSLLALGSRVVRRRASDARRARCHGGPSKKKCHTRRTTFSRPSAVNRWPPHKSSCNHPSITPVHNTPHQTLRSNTKASCDGEGQPSSSACDWASVSFVQCPSRCSMTVRSFAAYGEKGKAP